MRPGRFQLLKYRRDLAVGEDVAGKQEDGQAIDGGRGRAGDHVGGAGADGRRAGQRAQAVLHLGVADGAVNHRLLIARLVVTKVGVFLQGLAYAGHVAVAEDAEAAGKERLLPTVARHVLNLEELDQRLGHRLLHLKCPLC